MLRSLIASLACSGCFASAVSAQSPAVVPAAASSWYDHAVIYEIYPRSFQDSNGDGVGDLKGITQRLDYLQTLGIDAIWLTPFYPSPNLDFGYDVSNYTDVAPEYGTMADWDQLVAEAKKRHIRVLVDFVLNHSSDRHPWFLESKSSRDNPKRDWYVWHDGLAPGQPPTHWTSIFGGYTWTFDPKTKQWYYHIFGPYQPDVNWQNPGLRKAMFDVVRFWLDHGASGFRLDATPYLIEDPAFPDDPHPPKAGGAAALEPYNSARPENNAILREMRGILNGYPGNPVLLGESVTKDIDGLRKVYGQNRDEVQLPMNFMYGDRHALDAKGFKQVVDDAQTKLNGQTPVFFFSSHDHARQFTSFGDGKHDDAIARQTAAMTLLLRGTALVYYGEELGMANAPDSQMEAASLGPNRPRADGRDGERTPMQWNAAKNAGFTTGTPWLPAVRTYTTVNAAAEQANQASLLHWYQFLIALRKTPLFQDGSYVPVDSGNGKVFAFGRQLENSNALVVLNMSGVPQTVHLTGMALPQAAKVITSSPAASVPLTSTFTVAPYGTLVVGN